MNSSVNKLIIAAGVILVILIIVTIFISGSIKTKQTSQQPTLIPTGIFESSGGSGGFNSNDQQGSDQGAILARLSDEQRKLIKPGNEYSPISADQSSKLQDLASKMPYSSSDFDIGYSAALAQFFIQKKTPGADTALNKFFQDNGILDVFNQNPDLFVFTDQPVSQAIQNTESALGQIREENQNLQQQQTQQQNSQQTQQNQTKKPINLTKDQQQTIVRDNNMLKSFAEFAGSLFNFNTGSSSNLQDIVNSALTPIPTPTGNAGGGNNGGGGGGNNNYRNPLRAVKGLVSLRVDEGVDYFGSGPVYAIGNGQVAIYMNGNSDWPGGDWISYKLLDGPAKGFYVYVAEDCALNTSLHVGSIVNSNTVLCTMGPYIETGWAVSNADWAISHSYYCVRGPCSQGTNVDGTAMQSGLNFSAFMKYIGGPPGNPAASTNWPHQGIDPLPPGLPSW